jgi:hypothetical protein
MWNATGPDSNRNAPPGVVPDYSNPEDVYWTLNIALTVICVSFVTVFFLVRVYVKRTINRNIAVEDCTYKNCVKSEDQADNYRDMYSSICTTTLYCQSVLANFIGLCNYVLHNSFNEYVPTSLSISTSLTR